MSIELLAPAGNFEKLKIALLYGADAVYIAGQQFGLRSGMLNFDLDEISQAIKFTHEKEKKIYLATNAFLHDDEMKQFPEFLKALDQLEPDALICSDAGVVDAVRKNSRIPIHISTQTSVLNSWHARVWKEMGAKRIVVGRELSIEETSVLKKETGLEVEMFVHGAMCMAYSGHCSISTYVAGRDSNRGGCIQNCRFDYILSSSGARPVRSHFLSSKDLCGIGLLKQFISAGIDSLKIEGRMRSHLYIASTVRVYAQAIQDLLHEQEWRPDYFADELRKIPHRDYTEGSLQAPAGTDSVYNEQDEACSRYKMAGTVLAVDRQKLRFALQAKNKLQPGDKIEIMPFKGEIIQIEINEIQNMIDNHLPIVQPNNVFWLPWKPNIEVHNVARVYRPAQ